MPASAMAAGVSKSGSPAPRPMMSRPSAFSAAARAVTARVGEGLTRCTRRETGWDTEETCKVSGTERADIVPKTAFPIAPHDHCPTRKRWLPAQIRLFPGGGPAAGDCEPGQRPGIGPRGADAAGRHRFGQDLHDCQRDPAGAAPHAGDRAQQDAGGPALWRVPRVLPAQLRWSTSSRTTTTTSRRPTSRPRTRSSRRTRR